MLCDRFDDCMLLLLLLLLARAAVFDASRHSSTVNSTPYPQSADRACLWVSPSIYLRSGAVPMRRPRRSVPLRRPPAASGIGCFALVISVSTHGHTGPMTNLPSDDHTTVETNARRHHPLLWFVVALMRHSVRLKLVLCWIDAVLASAVVFLVTLAP